MEKQDRQWMINQAYNDLVKEIRRDLKDEILEDIHQQISQIAKILQNGRPIWASAKGESFQRIHDARQKLYTRIFYLREMWTTISERY